MKEEGKNIDNDSAMAKENLLSKVKDVIEKIVLNELIKNLEASKASEISECISKKHKINFN